MGDSKARREANQTRMSALVIDRIRARCRAAEALRDRPPFVPPAPDIAIPTA